MESNPGRKLLISLAATFISLITLPAGPAAASPVLVFECVIDQGQGLLPPGTAGIPFTIRRHVGDQPPYEEFVFDDWSLGRFLDNGRLEVAFTPSGGSPFVEEATSFRTALLDGRNGERDEVLEEALATGEASPVDDFLLQSFVMVLADAEGSAFDSHLVYPEQFELADYEQRECFVNWRAPAPAPCPGNPGLVCDGGTQRGTVTAFSTEPHGPDDTHGFMINSGLNDAWVNAGAALQGMFITVFEELGLVFLAWFTFDTPVEARTTTESAGAAATFGSDGQRWVTAVGAFSGNQATLKAELTTGGKFNSAEPVPEQDTDYGEIILEFTNCREGHVTFDFPSVGLSGEFDIARTLEDNVALCESMVSR